MQKIIKTILITLALISILTPINIKAKDNQVNLYLFYGRECPHCEKLREALPGIKKDYPNLKVYEYEVWHNQKNSDLMTKVSKLMNNPAQGVPYTIVGNQVITGYSGKATDAAIIDQIKYYSNNPLNDKVGNYLGLTKPLNDNEIIEKKPDKTFDIPVLGEISAKEVSLPFIAILFGILDGFNPCAMWILLFLISMLIGMENKTRRWSLGIAFLLTSAGIYLLFMLSWLSLTNIIGNIVYIRLLIAIVAVIGGYLNVKSYLDHQDDGCEVVDKKKRTKLIARIRKFTTEKSFILALLGVMALAISVNFIEIACSAGFPVVFMQLLSINDVNIVQMIVYIFLYILFFLIDDLVVFTIAMKTFELKGISTKYGKYSHLIGGILMLIIGTLLVLKPEWLMFNF